MCMLAHFDTSVTKKPLVLEALCVWVCPSVSESLCSKPKTLWAPYLKNKSRDFHPILATDVLGSVDMLIRFWGQKVKCEKNNNKWRDLVVKNCSRLASTFLYAPHPGDGGKLKPAL